MTETSPPGARKPVGLGDIAPEQRPAIRRYRSWVRFHDGPRQNTSPLLETLGKYPDAVLVAGCQRSGTTMLTRIIANAAGFRGLALTDDDELDAALTLCGEIDLPKDSRYCFQTTYLNERFPEYRMMGPEHRLIWVLRNPYSVVYSMVYNWRRFALNELYEGCGVALATDDRQRNLRWPWPWGPTRLEKGCHSYSAKTAQIESILDIVPREQVLIVDYDALVKDPVTQLRGIFAFAGVPFTEKSASRVRGDSVGKANRLSAAARSLIDAHAEPTYRRCLGLVTVPA